MTTTIFLRHATPTRNTFSVSQEGLRKRYAKGKLKAVWLHSVGSSLAAVEHVAGRHAVAPRDVSVYRVEVSLADNRLKRTGKPGWYYYDGDIDPSALSRPIQAIDLLRPDPWCDGNGGAAE